MTSKPSDRSLRHRCLAAAEGGCREGLASPVLDAMGHTGDGLGVVITAAVAQKVGSGGPEAVGIQELVRPEAVNYSSARRTALRSVSSASDTRLLPWNA